MNATDPATDPAAGAAAGTASGLHERLLTLGLRVASAESLTGGALADLLSGSPGASATYVGGVVSYATEVKRRLLHVSERTVREHGVVSARCAEEMARGVREVMGADLGVSTTGVAGPTPQEGKPVGLVYVAVAGPSGTVVDELHLTGERSAVRAAAAAHALAALVRALDLETSAGTAGTAT